MKNIKETINQVDELRTWSNYVNKERFMSYAEAKLPMTNREAESLWRVWDYIVTLNWYKLQEVSDEKMEMAVSVAREVYESVCEGAHIHWRENSPKTPRWRVYYRKGERGKIKQMDVNLREKECVIKYALLLQQEGVEILHRLDYYETLTPAMARELAEEVLYEEQGDYAYAADPLPDLGLDYAVVYDSRESVILQEGKKVLQVTLAQDDDDYLPLEVWTATLAQSLQSDLS